MVGDSLQVSTPALTLDVVSLMAGGTNVTITANASGARQRFDID
jgi:hypothetical protein